MSEWQNPLTSTDEASMHPDALAVFRHFQFDMLPVEGTFFKSTYRSTQEFSDGSPVGTAMIGMYCNQPLSLSCFHRLAHDEIWHFYGGDPFQLILLHPDGSSEVVIMGADVLRGQCLQLVIPAHTWQAGALLPGGRYALYACTMAPGFTGACFEAGEPQALIAQYPERAVDILRLSVKGHETRMPKGFAE